MNQVNVNNSIVPERTGRNIEIWYYDTIKIFSEYYIMYLYIKIYFSLLLKIRSKLTSFH